jgi:CheY-like chemotaxis protein
MFAARHDGVEALERTKDLKPDLILSDLAIASVEAFGIRCQMCGWFYSQCKSKPSARHSPPNCVSSTRLSLGQISLADSRAIAIRVYLRALSVLGR